MAQAGLGSRRGCELLISEGRVTVNGKVAILGMKADPQSDKIQVDGGLLNPPEALLYIAIYKPRGVLSAVTSPDPRPTVRDLIDLPGHFYPVGRLDVDSEGLMLLTNDGDLANRLTHPRYGHEKEYQVLVASRPDEQQLNTWRRGVVLPDGHRTAPTQVYTTRPFGKGMWMRVILKEGRKRQIRETGATIGLPVVKIIRVRIGSLHLGSLKARQWRYLTPEEIKDLKSGKKPPRTRKQPSRQDQRSSEKHPTGSKPGARKPVSARSEDRKRGDSSGGKKRHAPRKSGSQGSGGFETPARHSKHPGDSRSRPPVTKNPSLGRKSSVRRSDRNRGNT